MVLDARDIQLGGAAVSLRIGSLTIKHLPARRRRRATAAALASSRLS